MYDLPNFYRKSVLDLGEWATHMHFMATGSDFHSIFD